MSTTGTTGSVRRALLIGINEYEEKPLLGCVNDAQTMAALLTERFGFEEENVTLLLNRDASLARVTAELDRLHDLSQPDDLVCFFYAGHGSDFEQTDGSEASGYGTTFCLRDGDAREDLFDDDFGIWLDKLATRTEHVVLLIDCCHSATMTRGDEPVDHRAAPIRSMRAPATLKRPSGTRGGAHRRIGTPSSSQHVLIAACRDDQLASEVFLDETRTTTSGALTYSLSRELRNARSGDTWRDIFDRVAPQVTAAAAVEKSDQAPQYEGRIDRVLFELQELRPISPFSISARTREYVELNAGAMHGIVRNMVFTLYPAGSKQDDPVDVVGRVLVTQVRGTTSRARILGETPDGAITAGARAVSSAEDSFARALATENTSTRSKLRGAITVETYRQDDEAFVLALPSADGTPPVFGFDKRIGFRITNTSDVAVFINVFYFNPRGSIQRLGESNAYLVRPGERYDLGMTDREPQPTLSWDNDTVTAHFKLYASTQPVSLDYLTGLGESSRTTELIALDKTDDWTTVTVPVTLQGSASLSTDGPASLNGARVTVRGLKGTLVPAKRRRVESGTRGADDPLLMALSAEGLVPQLSYELDATPSSEEGTRSADATPVLELEVPEAGDGMAQLAMSTDESGLVHWHMPAATVSARGNGGSRTTTFVIPLQPTVVEGERSLLTTIGKRLIDVYVFPIGKAVIGTFLSKHAHDIELRRTPYRVRSFTPTDYASREMATVIDGEAWTTLTGGRALLMIHGTNSSTHSAFAALPRAVVESLHTQYEGRVFAFDHPTLTHTPKENIETLLAAMPDRTTLDVDIICHSRGGLVSRVLAERQDQILVEGRSVRVHKVVFVGSPNAGTRLCEADFVGDYLDTLTNLLAKAPVPGTPDLIAGVVMFAKIVAAGLYDSLTGIHSMQPEGLFGQWLNLGSRQEGTRYYALASNYKPTDLALARLAVYVLAGRVFKGVRNDLVVPTDGVFGANGSSAFPIADTVTFDGKDGIPHTGFFGDARVTAQIGKWLAS